MVVHFWTSICIAIIITFYFNTAGQALVEVYEGKASATTLGTVDATCSHNVTADSSGQTDEDSDK
jgi:hypothetical protein